MRQQATLIRQLSQSSPADRQGPPAPLFYFATRSDTIDVYYGTVQGFVRLGIPYTAHIMPPERQKDGYGFPLVCVTHDYGTDDLTCFDAGMT